MVRLGIDFGTTTTAAVIATAGGQVRPLLFDGSPLLGSAVLASAEHGLLVGDEAERAAIAHPGALEPNPKRRIDEQTVWLGEESRPVTELIAAVLRRVHEQAVEAASGEPLVPTLTHPATWGPTRKATLRAAAEQAGLAGARLLAEPVAAAAYFTDVLGRDVPRGRCLIVFDLGAGTFDLSIVRADGDGGFTVVAVDGLEDVGGLDLDQAVVMHARALTGGHEAAWGRLEWPAGEEDRRAARELRTAARAAKEQLSRRSSADLYVPLAATTLHITREEFERAALPHLQRTVAVTQSALRHAGVGQSEVAGLLLVGGACRTPLVATLLHRALRVEPVVSDQPQLAVAEGSVRTAPPPQTPLSQTPPVVVPRTAPAAAPGAGTVGVGAEPTPAVRARAQVRATPPPAARDVAAPAGVAWHHRLQAARTLRDTSSPGNRLWCVDVSGDERLVATNGTSGEVLLWNASTGRDGDGVEDEGGFAGGVEGVVGRGPVGVGVPGVLGARRQLVLNCRRVFGTVERTVRLLRSMHDDAHRSPATAAQPVAAAGVHR
ncbi:Hsp70 family protein [Dactylosporangium sp. NPDC006015]|uniref:Hsp70 family protein n=1 Tax=Dactylosporangium sp. NPDC006015 TaxID=3154576 RepID=UPI0033AE5C9F